MKSAKKAQQMNERWTMKQRNKQRKSKEKAKQNSLHVRVCVCSCEKLFKAFTMTSFLCNTNSKTRSNNNKKQFKQLFKTKKKQQMLNLSAQHLHAIYLQQQHNKCTQYVNSCSHTYNYMAMCTSI